jgi:hypothetical protein
MGDAFRPAAETVTITDATGATIPFVATSIFPWITLSQTATTLTVSVNPTGLTPGTHDGAIIITSPGAASNPQAI